MLNSPGFVIQRDPSRKLIRITMRGFWDDATVAAYDGAIKAEAAALMAEAGCTREELLALVDARELSAQSQTQLAEFKFRFQAPERLPKRIATVVSSMLVKRQAERNAPPNQRVFEDEGDALAWLLGDAPV